MAVKVKAPGAGPDTGTPKSIAPTRPAPPNAVLEVRRPTAQSYGEGGPLNNQSRTNPGEFVESDLGRNMRASVDDDGLLDKIIKDGTAKSGVDLEGSPQTRTVDDKPFPAAHGQSSRQANSGSPGVSAIPNKIGAVDQDYLARRNAALKRTS